MTFFNRKRNCTSIDIDSFSRNDSKPVGFIDGEVFEVFLISSQSKSISLVAGDCLKVTKLDVLQNDNYV